MISSGVVLDASVALSWAFDDEQSAFIDTVEGVLANGFACVPAAWSSEIANALVTGVRRGRISLEGVEEFLDALAHLDVRIEPPVATTTALVQFAVDAGLSAYDAEYVLLARERAMPLATGDRRMLEAARTLGVDVLG